jgi:hypothetical protein
LALPTQVRILLPPLPALEPEKSAHLAQLVEHFHGKEMAGVLFRIDSAI